MSYYLQFNFSLAVPLDVIDNAVKNSSNSIEPSPFLSKRLKTKVENNFGSPEG